MLRHRYLVAYDIRDPDRLRVVGQLMKSFGYRLQYSVFICDLDVTEKVALRREVGAVINHRRDRVAIVDLGDATSDGMTRFEFMGEQATLPRHGPTIV